MSSRQFPEHVSHATICAYFRAGIVVGVLPYERSKDWAYGVVESMGVPPIDVIEIASAPNRGACIDALQAAANGADHLAAGRWLLADLFDQLNDAQVSAWDAIRMAMRVATTTGLGETVYYAFDGLDDEMQLAVAGTYGNTQEIAQDVLLALAEHSGTTWPRGDAASVAEARDAMDVSDPYAAPASLPADRPAAKRAPSLARRAMLWGAISPFVLLPVAYCARWPALGAVLLIAFFIGPAWWWLWPSIRNGGWRAVSTGRFLATVLGAAGASVVGGLFYLLLLGIVSLIVVIVDGR